MSKVEPIHPELMHYGILRKSGRYPWGSGKDSYSRAVTFSGMVKDLKREGLSEKEIAEGFGLSIADLRASVTISKDVIVAEETATAVKLREKGMSPRAIHEQMGIPIETVRLRLKNSENQKASSLRNTADAIRAEVDKYGIVDVGKGNNLLMNVSPEKFNAALSVLRDEGYETYTLKTRNVGTDNLTSQKVIVPPDTGYSNAKKMTDDIHTMGKWTEDNGKTFFGIHEPMNISSSRLKVMFDEDGGTLQDGVVYVREGAEGLSMGKNRYLQTRIAIDGTHYIKGMAILKDDLPPGVDLVFHTNKSRSAGKLGALKELKRDADGNVDKDNPFGSIIKRQIVDIDPATGKERLKSAINIVNEEGDWETWSNSLPSQMLAKQPQSLIKSQLQTTRDQVRDRLAEIETITNAVVRKKALEDFAETVESDAVDLRAAAMPKQRTQVIMPVPNLPKNEVYAPRFETGERVVLIRYPHGGQFEIPEVTVNNNRRSAKKLLGDAVDAIGIHPSVAEKLSGADFDGDTVVVIPNPTGKIKGSSNVSNVYAEKLNNFDAKRQYGGFIKSGQDAKGRDVGNFQLMRNTGMEMGVITNLITDMSIQGANPEHVVRAVKHSMVVIDAEKHKLNYKQSEIDNGISQLKSLYQTNSETGHVGGASTLLSQATAKKRIPEIALRKAQDGGPVDKETGELVYVETGRTRNRYDKKTRTYDPDIQDPYLSNVKQLALKKDAYDLVRDRKDPVEKLYADHANEMKAIANQTRLKALRTEVKTRNPQAVKVYKDEVDRLYADLKKAEAQKPLDRRADVIAGKVVKAKRQEDPLLSEDRDRLRKVERQAKAAARSRLNLSKPVINIDERQWDAIQAGAVSPSKLRDILDYADSKQVMGYALPKKNAVMTSAVTARAKAMLAAGATAADVAAALGISASTLRSAAMRGDV